MSTPIRSLQRRHYSIVLSTKTKSSSSINNNLCIFQNNHGNKNNNNNYSFQCNNLLKQNTFSSIPTQFQSFLQSNSLHTSSSQTNLFQRNNNHKHYLIQNNNINNNSSLSHTNSILSSSSSVNTPLLNHFHSSSPNQSVIAAAIGAAVVAGGLKYVHSLYQEMRRMRPDQQAEGLDPHNTENTRFYEGGFEEPMSKREAALILGCRENATKEKIMARYRTLMKVNHPDLGGSPFLSSKINEAKELLSKTARSESDKR